MRYLSIQQVPKLKNIYILFSTPKIILSYANLKLHPLFIYLQLYFHYFMKLYLQICKLMVLLKHGNVTKKYTAA